MLDPHMHTPHEILAAKEELAKFYEGLDQIQQNLLGLLISGRELTEEGYDKLASEAVRKIHGFSDGRWTDRERRNAVNTELRALLVKISREFADDSYRLTLH